VTIGTTSDRGYPYPESDEPLTNGWDAIRDLAEAVDNDVAGLAVGVGGAWQTYTPALTAVPTSPTLGSGAVQFGEWQDAGGTIHFTVRINFKAGMAAGSGTYRIGLPANVAASWVTEQAVVGNGTFYDASADQTYHLTARCIPSSNSVVSCDLNGVAGGGFGHSKPVAPAAGDEIWLRGTYRKA
jgi:hypothetical protein